MSESPAATMRRATALMRKRAEAATPGPWERPLDTRHKDVVIAALPDNEEGSYRDGMIPAKFASHSGLTGRYAGQRERVPVVSASIWSIGGFTRKRSGRDLDHVASWHPLVALVVAEWLEAEAISYDELGRTPYGAEGAAFVAGDFGGDVDPALKLARLYLGEEAP